MKKALIVIGILSFLGYKAKTRSSKENKLVKQLGFDSELMQVLEKEINKELIQLPAIDQKTAEVLETPYDGLCASVSEKKGNAIVKKLKEKFRAKGYLIFLFTGNQDSKKIGVIRGTNDLDILRYRRTDGINHGYENEDIVAKISEWKNEFGLVVIGCGRDWLELEFKTLPADLEAFAEEVYAFCRDAVDQGLGDVENLQQLIEDTNGVWLWWD